MYLHGFLIYTYRSCITIFHQRTKPGHDFRIWNDQLIRYAGYEREKADKTHHIIGDPASVEFTKVHTCIPFHVL